MIPEVRVRTLSRRARESQWRCRIERYVLNPRVYQLEAQIQELFDAAAWAMSDSESEEVQIPAAEASFVDLDHADVLDMSLYDDLMKSRE